MTLNGDCTIGYLPQTMRVADTTTLAEETAKAFEEVLRLEAEIEHLTHEIAERTDYESDGYAQLLHRLNDAQDHYHILGGETREADIEKTLLGLGFKRGDFGRPTSEFSGGWRMRIELAKLLLRRPSIFLLDEPTNHMDMRSKDILKNAIMKYDGTVVIVSHDREFLDGMVQKVYEFRDGGVKEYLGGIYYFLEKRKLESLQEVERRDTPQKPAVQATPKPEAAVSGKLTYEQRKEQEKQLRKLRRTVEGIEAELAAIEKQIAAYDAKFAAATAYDEADYKAYNDLKARYDHQMHEWEKASYELELVEEQ